MRNTFRYDTIFMYGSLQSVGHTMEYFVRHTRKLVVFIVMPRVNGTENLVRVYHEGTMISERHVPSSRNILLYYLRWWYHHNLFLLTFFHRRERVLVFTGHPIALFGMSIIKLIRRVTYAYWIGDYYPPVNVSLILFEKLKKYYHDRVSCTFYLSDLINEKLNGSVRKTHEHRTVMWGIEMPKKRATLPRIRMTKLLFVGVVRPGQGLEEVFEYLSRDKTVCLSVIGVCESTYYALLQRLIKKLSIQDQIFFPNTFYSDTKLRTIAKDHHIGIALYDESPKSASFYTDPGKVKTYVEMGLPVVMTKTSAIAPYVRRFGCGETVSSTAELPRVLDTMKRQYERYQDGLVAFSRYFAYESYYRNAFVAFEEVS
ncbi:MAG TPA: hypothetical protein VJB96_04470 [Patescibacteria group bacterium]|nr:hypothetical protein [Patescibacteria group bacterium]